MKLLKILLPLLFFFEYSQAQNEFDQLKKKYDSLRNIGKINEALPIAKAMNTWALTNQGDTSLIYAVTFRYIGNCFQTYDSTLKYYEISKYLLEIQNNDHHIEYARVLNNLGYLYKLSNDFTKSEELYLHSINILLNLNEFYYLDYNRFLNNIANLYFINRNYISSIHYYKLLLESQNKQYETNKLDISSTLLNLSILNTKINNYKDAKLFLDQALSIQDSLIKSINFEYYKTLQIAGQFYEKTGVYNLAESYYWNSVKANARHSVSDEIGYAYSLYLLGFFYSSIGQYDQAEQCCKSALSVQSNILGESSVESALTMSTLGNIYSLRGDFNNALTLYTKSLEIIISKKGVYNEDYISVINSLAVLYGKIGNIELANEYLLSGLNSSSTINGKESIESAIFLMNLGIFKADQASYKEAQKYLIESEIIIKNQFGNKHPKYAWALNNLGYLEYKLGNYTQAIYYLTKSIEIKKEVYGVNNSDYATSMSALGLLFLKMGEKDSALNYCSKAIQLISRNKDNIDQLYLSLLYNLGIVYEASNNYTKATEIYEKVIKLNSSIYKSTFGILSSKEKKYFKDSRNKYYDFIPSYTASAYKYYPRASILLYNSNLIIKSLLVDHYRILNYILKQTKDTLLYNSYQALIKFRENSVKLDQFNSYNNIEIANNKEKIDSLEIIITRQIKTQPAITNYFDMSWAAIANSLNNYEAAIEFTRYYDYNDTCYKYLAQVIRTGYEYPKIIFLCKENELPSSSLSDNLHQLYELLWKPIDSLLNEVKTVYYSPDGKLFSVPFDALCSSDTTGCTYLIDRYTLHRLSSTRYLADNSLVTTKELNGNIALFGGIRYDVMPDSIYNKKEKSNEDFLLASNLKQETTRGTMPYLQGTKLEVERIAKTCKNLRWTSSLSTGSSATETAFKNLSDEGSPSIIHIATHGFAFPDIVQKKTDRLGKIILQNGEQSHYKVAEDPMLRCGLAFAGANISWSGRQQEMLDKTGEDGILTAAEVANLDLSNTKLVVLSACETGLGKIEGSEGVFGLQRGFKLAGVEQLIVSLWSVPDKETAQMMESFYSDLAITKDPVQSFANAQKEMRNRFPDNPEKWAGFVLVR